MRKLLFLVTLLLSSVVQASGPSIQDAYVPQPPPGQTMAVMYLTVHNPLEQTLFVLSASSSVTARVELHTHVHDNGQMKMRAVPRVELPPGQDTAFKPGGLHLMLFGLKRALKAGEQVPVTLSLSDGTQLHATATVRDLRR